MGYAVRAENLSKKFGDEFAVKNMDFEIGEGEIVAFLGPNGAGKTTTVRLLNGVLNPTFGEAEVLGYSLIDNPKEIQKRSGVVTESLSLYERLTGTYNLEFHSDLYGVDSKIAEERITEITSFFGLSDYIDDPVETYSTGMKKKLSLAKALLHDPEILFLDEPTTGLDPETSKTVINYIKELNKEQKKTTFLCTHNLGVAEALATRIMLIDEGELVEVSTPKELRQKLWPETEVEIICKNWRKSLEKELNELSWVKRVEVIDKDRVMGRDDLDLVEVDIVGEDRTPDLVELFVDKDCRIYSIKDVDHSLEDIYFEIRGDSVEY